MHLSNARLYLQHQILACVKAASDYLVKEGYIEQAALSIAITNYALTKVLWLKKPMSTPDLPRTYVIAECYVAMEPGESLWQLKERDGFSEE